MTVRIGINGFGRIGRNVFRSAAAWGSESEIVAVNDLGGVPTMAHPLADDSILGRFPPGDHGRAGCGPGGRPHDQGPRRT